LRLEVAVNWSKSAYMGIKTTELVDLILPNARCIDTLKSNRGILKKIDGFKNA
jgi:hypothetical protein